MDSQPPPSPSPTTQSSVQFASVTNNTSEFYLKHSHAATETPTYGQSCTATTNRKHLFSRGDVSVGPSTPLDSPPLADDPHPVVPKFADNHTSASSAAEQTFPIYHAGGASSTDTVIQLDVDDMFEISDLANLPGVDLIHSFDFQDVF